MTEATANAENASAPAQTNDAFAPGERESILADMEDLGLLKSNPGESLDEAREAPPDEAGSADADQDQATRSSPRQGVRQQDVLAHLESTMPEGANVIRGLDRRISEMQSELTAFRTREDEVRQLAQEIQQLKADRQAPDEEALASQLTPEQQEMWRIEAERQGYVRREDLEKQREEAQAAQDAEAANSYASQAIEDAAQILGDAFAATGADGTLNVAPEIQAQNARVLERLQDPRRGVTSLDLFALAQLEREPRRILRLLEDEAAPAPSRAESLAKANTMRTPRSIPSQPRVYNPEKDRGADAIDKVLDRVWATIGANGQR